MIRPDMATMLCFLMTDIEASSEQLSQALTAATDKSLNRMTIDGDTSTNDTALLMANGKSEAQVLNADHMAAFQSVLDDVLITLAKQLVQDGEGVTIMSVERSLRQVARKLLSEKQVDLIIGYEKGSMPLRTTPCFISSIDDVDKLVWNESCENNLAKYVVDRKEKVGVVVSSNHLSIQSEILQQQESIYSLTRASSGSLVRLPRYWA